MRSRLYAGNVWHRRTGPRAYDFKYGIFYYFLDLEEIDEAARRLRLLSRNRFNVTSFLDRDHVGAPGEGVRDAVHRHLRGGGIDAAGCDVGLLTNARVMNYVFNPVSFILVRERDGGVLRHVIAEVHNTHGERHLYDLARDPADAAVYRSSADKQFYVSPFIDMEGTYAFELREDGGVLSIRINESRDGESFFEAALRVSPMPLTDRNIARMLARYPFVTVKTIAMIHWQGLKLWLRGERYRPHTPKEEANP